MKPTRTTVIILLLFAFGIIVSQAQGECTVDIEAIVAQVTEQCQGIGQNQVCYGNRNVVATPRLNTGDFNFDEPGDRVNLSNIESLFVSAIDPNSGDWGVAQMRLQVSSATGSQDMMMLLFGAFTVENAVESTATVMVSVRSRATDIRSTPDVTALSLESATLDTQLLARGRLDDTSWLRVENQATGIIGWVLTSTVEPVSESASVGILPVQTADTPYYGAMQAFYFTSGSTNIGCDNIASDGLLIQTPEGVARISLLINEVSIELTGGGAGSAGTAFIEANPDSEEGMEVSVVSGQAEVSTGDGSSQTVAAGQQSSIPMDEDMRAEGAPTIPITIDFSNLNFSVMMPTFSTGSGDSSGNGGVGNGSSVDLNPSNDDPNNSNGGSGNGNGNGSNVLGGGSSSSSSSGNSGNGAGGVDLTVAGGNGNSNGSMPTSLDEINAEREAASRPQAWTQGNILALTLAVIAAVMVIGGIVFYTVSSKRR